MQTQAGFIAKVLLLSIAIAIALKTIAPRLPIPATSTVSLVIISTPTLIMGAFLCWQLWTSHDSDSSHTDSH